MSERDDALRRQLGWTGPEESDYEPAPAPVEPTSHSRLDTAALTAAGRLRARRHRA